MPAQITIKLRAGTAVQWGAANPILASGECGLETDTRKLKVGDGTTAWSSLGYCIDAVFTDTMLAKLNGVQSGAQVNPAAATSGELAALTENTSRLFSPAQLRTAISTVSNPLDVGFAKTTQDIIDCIAAGKKVVNIAAGTFDISTTLALPSLIRIVGAGPGNTILNWVGGAAPAIDSATPTTRTYSTSIEHLTLQNSGSGTVGINWSAISSGRLNNLLVKDFTTQYALVGSNGYCVYNRIRDCTAQGGTTGFLIGGTGSNANSLIGCRGNAVSGWCVDIVASNNTVVSFGQFESSTSGIRVRSDSVADGDATLILGNRFEALNGGSGGTAIQIAGPNTRDAAIIHNYMVSTGGTISDAGTRTTIISMVYGAGAGPQLVAATPYAVAGGAFRFSRSAAATDVPMLVMSDTNTGSGAPVTLEINTERAGGAFLRGRRGGTTYAQIRADGKGLFTGGIGVGNSVTAASMGALSRRVQVFDENGNSLGYMPIYVS